MCANSSLSPGGGGDDGDTTPEYQPPEMPEMDVKPAMMKSLKSDQDQYVSRLAGQEFAPSHEAYLPTTSSQQWHYNHHQMGLGGAPPSNSYLGHDIPRGYGGTGGRDITAEEFQEGEEGGDMDAMKGREEIGHYDSDMISQTGPIRGYPRSDGFVWRPY